MIQVNHQNLRKNGVKMDYSKQLMNFRSHNRKLRYLLACVEDTQVEEIEDLKSQIKLLEQQRDQLREDKDSIHDLFKQYKDQIKKLENTIKFQEEELIRNKSVVEQNERLSERVAHLRRQFEESTRKMRTVDRDDPMPSGDPMHLSESEDEDTSTTRQGDVAFQANP